MSQALQNAPPLASGATSPLDAGTFLQRLFLGVRRIHARFDWVDFVGESWPDHIMAADVTDDFNAKQGRLDVLACIASILRRARDHRARTVTQRSGRFQVQLT